VVVSISDTVTSSTDVGAIVFSPLPSASAPVSLGVGGVSYE